MPSQWLFYADGQADVWQQAMCLFVQPGHWALLFDDMQIVARQVYLILSWHHAVITDLVSLQDQTNCLPLLSWLQDSHRLHHALDRLLHELVDSTGGTTPQLPCTNDANT